MLSRPVLILTIVFALLHVICGVISMCVGVAASAQSEVWLAYTVSPMWSGPFFIVTGLLGLACAKRRTAYAIGRDVINMAASCLGVVGTFQYSAPRCKDGRLPDLDTAKLTQLQADKTRCVEQAADDEFRDMCPVCSDEIVWITKSYQPTDPRFTAPVPRFKIVARDPANICKHRPKLYNAAGELMKPRTARSYTRADTEKEVYVSQHHTRCEQWSTLREMLPSRGRPVPLSAPNWGTGRGVPPSLVGTRASRFPSIESEMTRFVSLAYKIDRQFSLF